MKLAILTFHKAYNCGAMLQAWALKTVLERMGHTVEFPDCNTVGQVSRFQPVFLRKETLFRFIRSTVYRLLRNLLSIGVEDLSRLRYNRFRRHFLTERHCKASEIATRYEGVVVGSDQVWQPNLIAPDEVGLFLGEDFADRIPTIAYATSIGDTMLPKGQTERIRKAAKAFKAISAREALVQNLLSPQEISIVVDPTLLLVAEDYRTIETAVRTRERFLFAYVLRATPFCVHSARALAKHLGVKPIITPVYQYSRFVAPSGLTYGVSPDRMVGYMARATYVLASSFHGTVFALLNKKPFLSLREDAFDKAQHSRPASLLRQVGLLDRLATPERSEEEMLARLQSPLPERAYEKLSELREDSLTWLKEAVEKMKLFLHDQYNDL